MIDGAVGFHHVHGGALHAVDRLDGAGELTLDRLNLPELVARTITAQVKLSKGSDNGMAFACLGLLAFGSSRERNPVWEILSAETKKQIEDKFAQVAHLLL